MNKLRVASKIRTRFLRSDFRQYFVKILVNPRGFTAFYVLSCQKSAPQKIADPKVRTFVGFLDGEDADRLAPFKSEAPESCENSRFWAGSDYTRHPTAVRTSLPPCFLVSDYSKAAGLRETAKGGFCRDACEHPGTPNSFGGGAPTNYLPALTKYIFIHTNQKIMHKIS